MYCSQCGKAAEGRFCSNCGVPLASQAEGEIVPISWENETRYEAIVRHDEVRAMIERQARLAPKGMTGEQFLQFAGKLVSPGVPLDKVIAIAQPIYERFGIGTGKQRTVRIDAPVGRTLVRTLCSMARRGQPVRSVKQAADGCVLEAALPSDIWSFEGDLLVTVRSENGHTEVSAATKIKGQLYDWGKSRRCLDRLFADLESDPA